MPKPLELNSSTIDHRNLFRALRGALKARGGGDTQQSLQSIVTLLAEHFGSNVCSLYQYDSDLDELFLRATIGLRAEAVGHTVLHSGEGLVGTIAQTRHPLALERAQEDERFIFRPETGEEIYQSFLGVPLIRADSLLGVLVLQHQEPRAYSPEEIEDCETVAQFLSEMLQTPGGEFSRDDAKARGTLRFPAVPLSPGLVFGRARIHLKDIVIKRWREKDSASEIVRLEAALIQMERALETLLANPKTTEDTESAELLEADLMLTRDEGWRRRIVEAIETGLSAEAAVQNVRKDLEARMKAVSNDYIRARLQDLDDLSYRLLSQLTGDTASVFSDGPEPDTILICRSLGTAELLQAGPGCVAGLVVADATPSSHLAIIANSMNIPALGQAAESLSGLRDGDMVILDAFNGQLIGRPDPSVVASFEAHIAARQEASAEHVSIAGAPSISRDGVEVQVMANAGLLLDLEEVDRTAAAGIGLYRTEMMFLIRSHLPDIEEQTTLYRRIFDRMGDRPVVFRTLDVGSDKKLAYLEEHEFEANPALGWRAIRVSLDKPKLLQDQLRALFAAADGRPLRIMFPMISEAEELIEARALLTQVQEERQSRGEKLPSTLDVGIMIEVPALLWDLERALEYADFASVGTNDLFQFLNAADRNNAKTENRFEVLKPSNLRLLSEVANTARRVGKPVSVCGELASSPLGVTALLGCGFRSFSMNPNSIPTIKAVIRATDVASVVTQIQALSKLEAASVRNEIAAILRSFEATNFVGT